MQIQNHCNLNFEAAVLLQRISSSVASLRLIVILFRCRSIMFDVNVTISADKCSSDGNLPRNLTTSV